MWTQRISVINDQDDHLGVLENVTPENVVILPSSDGFLIEYKLRLLTDPKWPQSYPLIAALRIQSRTPSHESFGPVLDYGFSPGTSVYIRPQLISSNEARQQFYDQAQSLLDELLGISVTSDDWIYTTRALYYYTDIPLDLNVSALAAPNPLVQSLPVYDLYYDTKTLTVKQVSVLPKVPLTINRQDYKTELGIFLIDKQVTSSDDILLDGVRAILDKQSDDKQFAFETMIHIKPRHRALSNVTHEIVGSGLHPVLRTSFTDVYAPPLTDGDIEECELYYYINLNKSLIFDQYQSVPTNYNLVLSRGNNDLELPAYKIDSWGSEILFKHANASLFTGEPIDFTVHSRYQLPHQNDSHTFVSNVHPQVFWGCRARDPQYLSASPFDSKQSIGGNYDMFFTDDTVYYHFEPQDSSPLEVAIPNARSSAERITWITSVSVVIGCCYVLYQIARAFISQSKTAPDTAKKEKVH